MPSICPVLFYPCCQQTCQLEKQMARMDISVSLNRSVSVTHKPEDNLWVAMDVLYFLYPDLRLAVLDLTFPCDAPQEGAKACLGTCCST